MNGRKRMGGAGDEAVGENYGAAQSKRNDPGGACGHLRREQAVYFQMGGGYCAAGSGKAFASGRGFSRFHGCSAEG